MNGEEIESISFYDDLENLFHEYIPEMSLDEEFEYTFDDLHSVWVYLYKSFDDEFPCYREVDIKATIFFTKIEEFLEKHKMDNYIDALCFIIVLEQKMCKLLEKYKIDKEQKEIND